MDVLNSYATPPPYSRLNEENHNNNPPPAGTRPLPSGDYALSELKKDDPGVTIHLGEKVASHQETNRCILKGFLCGCSLRSGCITVAVLYSLYILFFTGIAISDYITTYMEQETNDFSSHWGLNLVLFECCMALFVIGFIVDGLRKANPQRLLVAKWLMVVDICMNLVQEIQAAFLMDVYGLLIHIVMQIIPVYFIFIVHSYEAELRKKAKIFPLPVQNGNLDAAFSK